MALTDDIERLIEEERLERIESLLQQRRVCQRSINFLEEKSLSYGANPPLEIQHQLADAHEKRERIEQELRQLQQEQAALGQDRARQEIDEIREEIARLKQMLEEKRVTPATSHPTAAPPAAWTVRVREKDGAEMVCVPAGEFLMGSSDGDNMAFDDEKPRHTVYLDTFWIDRYPVTNAQYGKFLAWMRETGDHSLCHSDEPPGKGHTPRFWDDPKWNAPDKPVVGVDWYDAYAYAAWAGARLPTEAEWEKAARGSDGRIYPWGNEWDAGKANTAEQGPNRTTAVGSFPAGVSPCGALDMSGNVWEWVADWYDGGYYARSPGRNPTGPDSGEYRVLRGGSWLITQRYARVSSRNSSRPDYFFYYYYFIGLRLVCAPV